MEEILIALILFVVGLYGVASSSKIVIERFSISDGRTLTLLKHYIWVLYGFAVVAAMSLQTHIVPGERMVSFVATGSPTSGGIAVANGLSLGLLLVLSVFVVERGLRPELIDLYAHRGLVDQRFRRRKRVAAAGVLFGSGLLLEGVLAGWINELVALTAGLVLLRASMHLRIPALVPGETARRPEPSERDRIEEWYGRDGSPDDIVVFAGDGTRERVIAGGRGGTRWLRIHEALLSGSDDEALGIVLSQAEAKRRAGFWRTAALAETTAFALIAATLAIVLPADIPWSTVASSVLPSESGWDFRVFLTLLLGIVVTAWILVILKVAFRVVRRSTFEADDEVASQFGVSRVVEAYRNSDSLHFLQPSEAVRGQARYEREPSRERRIERLCEGHSIESPIESETRSEHAPSLGALFPRLWPGLIAVSTFVWVGFAGYHAASVWLDYARPLIVELVVVLAWYGVPIGLYYDTKRTRSTSQWPANRKPLIALSLVPIANIGVGCWYVWKRRQRTLEVPDDAPSGA